MSDTVLTGGFASPPAEASQAFRSLLEAMARPGTIHGIAGAVPPAPVSPAAGAVLLTLCDPETPVFLAGACDTANMRDWLAFHTGAPLSAPEDCVFALGAWSDLAPLSRFSIGTPEYSDRSATLIVEVSELTQGGAALRGPGIRDRAALSLPDTQALRANNGLFPLGLDFYFTCGDRVAALPRSTEVL